ncbi:MAG: N-acetylmuramoyl-L-alanine amidase [Bacteroidota bacterium]|nr:N-acetylmuramoyl-L-alanine amidase [Bacteroidota bacterium]
MKIFFLMIVLIAFVYSCTRSPYAATNRQYKKQEKNYSRLLKQIPDVSVNDTIKQPAYFAGTTNFGLRKPNFVIIHHTAQNSCDQTLKTFTTVASKVSAHYVICKDGTVHHMLNDYFRAYHAGVSRWGNLIDVNSSSIGIEIDNNGFEAFTDEQINSLLSLLATLKKKYDIPAANFIGHGDIAPRRKNDPNVYFPWKKLAEHGFGLWYDEVRDSVPANFNPIQALRIVGYDVKDTTAAIRAFKRHFMQDTTRSLNDADKNVLFNLQKKYF